MRSSTLPAEFGHLERLYAAVRGRAPRTVAVVQPVGEFALAAALDAASEGFIRPILVGDRVRIRALADVHGFDLEGLRIVDAGDDGEAASTAVALARAGECEILMKGHLHSDDFLRPMLDRAGGLRTDRTMSHVFVCYLPQRIYPKPLLVTDAAFNIAPDLGAKRAILDNAIQLAHVLGIPRPKVAILAATEVVSPAMQATLDAQALRETPFAGAIVDGPFAFDNAVSRECAQSKGIDSPVCGDPDILLVPDIEAGNMLYKQMVHFSGAITPGLVLGATVPAILTSRADPREARLASCALATAYADAHR